MKGVSYRVSTFRPEYRTSEGLVDISNSILYATNKKVAFQESTRSTSIPYRRLAGLELYADGLEIRKFAGGNDFF